MNYKMDLTYLWVYENSPKVVLLTLEDPKSIRIDERVRRQATIVDYLKRFIKTN